MLDKIKVIESLENKKNEFINYKSSNKEELNALTLYLNRLFKVTAEEITQILLSIKAPPGAIPTTEWDDELGIISFSYEWYSHQQARDWAYNILLNKTTFAVDGSQILPSKDYSPSIAAIQVSKFENFHSIDGKYNKELLFDVISPQELNESLELFPFKDVTSIMEQYINYKRFELETNTIINYMQNNVDKKPKPLVFFDGGLIISFVIYEKSREGEENKLYNNYINQIQQLLKTSEETQIPVIGYIDSSSAHDLVNMIKNYFDYTDDKIVTDAQLINNLMKWGDRLPVLYCKRHGVLLQYGDYKDKMCFTYLKANNKMPARVEFPSWVFENKSLFQEIIDIIRAEIVIGSGYVYSIESADAVAVITNEDKQYFYKIFNDFALKYELDLNLTQKAISKSKRR